MISRQIITRIGVILASILVTTGCGGSAHRPKEPVIVATQQTPVTPRPTANTAVIPTAAPTDAPSPTPKPPNPSSTAKPGDQIATAINTLIDGEAGVYGIILMQPDGTVDYEQNVDTPFIAASLYKLVLLPNIYEKREKGEITFDDELELLPEYFPDVNDSADGYFDWRATGSSVTIDELMFAAGAFSSNVAAKALLSITTTGSLDATSIELGLQDTYLFIDPASLTSWPPSPTASAPAADIDEAATFVRDSAADGLVNITTPRDMAHFFQLLLAGEIVSPKVSQELLAILKQQMVDYMFPYLLPYPTDMAHKTGNLDHVVHDVGVIWTPDGPVILVAMIEDPPDDDRAIQIIQRLAVIAYGIYDVPAFTEQAVMEEATVDDATSDDAPDESTADESE